MRSSECRTRENTASIAGLLPEEGEPTSPHHSQDDVQTSAGRLVRMSLLSPEDAQREVQTAQQYGDNTQALRS